jgi:hypothetical protein
MRLRVKVLNRTTGAWLRGARLTRFIAFQTDTLFPALTYSVRPVSRSP